MTGVAVVGAGIIGKRMAHAIAAHPELDLAGVGVRRPNGFVLARPDLPYFATEREAAERLRGAGVRCAGSLDELLARADLVIDCGPSCSGAGRLGTYRTAGVGAVFCGGERDPRLGPLVHPRLEPDPPGNRADARSVRLTSCNTTALARVVAAVGAAGIEELDATVVRCGTDTDKAGKGVTDGAVLSVRPSHHATDLRSLLPALRARSVAMTVAMTAGHVIRLRLRLSSPSAAAALERLRSAPWIAVLDEETIDTVKIKESIPGYWHNRYALLVQAVDVAGADLDLWLCLDNEAITVPEALEVLAVLGGAEPDKARRSTESLLAGPVRPSAASGPGAAR